MRPICYCLCSAVFVNCGWASGGETGNVIDGGNGDGACVDKSAEGINAAVVSGVSGAAIKNRERIRGAEGDAVGDSAVVVGSGWLEVNAGIGIGGK